MLHLEESLIKAVMIATWAYGKKSSYLYTAVEVILPPAMQVDCRIEYGDH